jgi:hypothetical protein
MSGVRFSYPVRINKFKVGGFKMNLTNLIIWTIVSMWVIGELALLYYGIVHLFAKEYPFAIFCFLAALFPPSAIISTAIIYAGLIRYFLLTKPKKFKQLIADLKEELMFDLCRKEVNMK